MEYNYITLGYDCSTAATLKNLSLRSHSLPFDWVVSNIDDIIRCISEDFINFHKDLYLNSGKTRLIDHYGFEYPHDYPNSDVVEIDNVGNGVFGETTINDNWRDFIDINLEKYNRRSKRFLDILKSDTDLIVLYRGPISNIIKFKNFMKYRFNKDNIKYVVATTENCNEPDIISCNPEINGEWNDHNIWGEAIKKAKD